MHKEGRTEATIPAERKLRTIITNVRLHTHTHRLPAFSPEQKRSMIRQAVVLADQTENQLIDVNQFFHWYRTVRSASSPPHRSCTRSQQAVLTQHTLSRAQQAILGAVPHGPVSQASAPSPERPLPAADKSSRGRKRGERRDHKCQRRGKDQRRPGHKRRAHDTAALPSQPHTHPARNSTFTQPSSAYQVRCTAQFPAQATCPRECFILRRCAGSGACAGETAWGGWNWGAVVQGGSTRGFS